MRVYMVKRLLLFVPTVLLVTAIVFVLLRVVPGDPALLLLAGDVAEEDLNFQRDKLEELRAELGTDRNIIVQYVDWVLGMLRGDFGESFFYQTPAIDDIKKKFPVTLQLAIMAVILASGVAVPLGAVSAIKQDTKADYATRVITLLGIALPNFWIGIMVILFLAMLFNWIPPLLYNDLWDSPWQNIQQLFFPALALGFSNMAFIARITRSAMLEVLREDYIRTARAKGMKERIVISRHALRNALLPVVTVAGYEFGSLISGTVAIEVIFTVPGMGRLLISSILWRDYTMIQAIIVIIAVLILTLNVVLDLLYAWLNPRIRYT